MAALPAPARGGGGDSPGDVGRPRLYLLPRGEGAPLASGEIAAAGEPVGVRIDAASLGSEPGPRSLAIEVEAADGGVGLAAFALLVAGPGVVLARPPSGLFGSVPVGGRAEVALALEVGGAVAVELAAARLEGDAAGDFALASGGEAGVLAPGAPSVVNVAFGPTAPGWRSATLVIEAANDGGEGPADLLLRVPLAGQGISPEAARGRAEVVPARLDLGVAPPLGVAGPGEATLENVGDAALLGLSVGLDGADAFALDVGGDGGCGGLGRLEPGERCTASVRYTPHDNGLEAAVLVFGFDGTASATVVVTAGGEGFGPPVLSTGLADDVLDFGAVDAPRTREVTVFNSGETTSPALLAVAGGEAFSLSQDGCTETELDPGEACTLVVRFAPAANLPYQGTLRIWGANPLSVTLSGSGEGLRPGALTADPVSLDFGELEPGGRASRLLNVRNPGSTPVAGLQWRVEADPAGVWTIRGGGQSPCSLGAAVAGRASCVLEVELSPDRNGDVRGTLVLGATGMPDSVVVLLTGHGAGFAPPALSFEPALERLDFGATHEAAVRAVGLTNEGDHPTGSLAVRVLGAAFSVQPGARDTCSGAVLPPAARCSVELAFEPSGNGLHTGQVEVTDGDATVRAELVGTGMGYDPATLVGQPDHVEFGPIGRDAESDPLAVVVLNEGDLPAQGVRWELSGDGAEFSVEPAAEGGCVEGAALDGGNTCLLEVRFNPLRSGDRRAALRVTFAEDAGDRGATIQLSGLGAGFDPAHLAAAPAEIDFGEVAWPDESPARLVQVTNEGDLPADPLSVLLQGARADDYRIVPDARQDACVAGGSLAGGATCTASVVFAPAGEGSRQATLDVSAPGTIAGPVALTGLGTGFGASVLALADEGASPAFGEVDDEEYQEFLYTNAGGVTTGSIGVQLLGSDRFRIPAGLDRCSGRTLAADAVCSVGVMFSPQGNGAFEAALRVTDGQDEVVVALTGTGIGFLPPELVADPVAVAFGDIGEAAQSDPITVRFANDGEQAATGLELRVEGGQAALFPLQEDGDQACLGRDRLAGDEECLATVRLVPDGQVGAFSATLVLDAAEGSVEVPLSGRSGAPERCPALKEGNPDAESRVDCIAPDGDGGNDPIDVFCQMDWGDGGWVLALSRNVDLSNPGQYGHSRTWRCLTPSLTPPQARDANSDLVLHHSVFQALGASEMMLMGGERILKLYYPRPGGSFRNNYRQLTERTCAGLGHDSNDAPHTGAGRQGEGHADDACTTADWAGFQARSSCGRDATNSHQDNGGGYCDGICGSFGNGPGNGTTAPSDRSACWFYGGSNAAQQPQIWNCPEASRAPWADYSTGTLEGQYNLWVR